MEALPDFITAQLPADYRERAVEVGGEHMHVFEWGPPDGRPIVLVQVERTGKDQRDSKFVHSEDAKEYLAALQAVPGVALENTREIRHFTRGQPLLLVFHAFRRGKQRQPCIFA